MKKVLPLLFIFLIIGFKGICQEKNAERSYVRPSLSVVEISTSDARLNIDRGSVVPAKFDENHLSKDFYKISYNEFNKIINESVGTINHRTTLDFLKKNRITNEVILEVLPIKEGKFSNEVIKQRGTHSATDAQVNQIKGTISEQFIDFRDNFSDIGIQQLDKIYILLVGTYGYSVKKYEDSTTHELMISYALVKVNNALEAYSQFKDDPVSFKDADWGAKVIFSDTKKVSKNVSYSVSKAQITKYLQEGIKNKMFQTLDRMIVDFQPKTTAILNNGEIIAKVGTKESLSIDNRFFVYEQLIDESGEGSLAKRGTLRVKAVGDNKGVSDGNSEYSTFYKIAGKRVMDGMLLIQKEDIGIGITLGFGNSQRIRVDYRLKGIYKGFKGYVTLNHLLSDYITFERTKFAEILGLSGIKNLNDINNKVGVNSISMEAGIEWAYIISSRFQLLPYIGFAYVKTKFVDTGSIHPYYYGNWGVIEALVEEDYLVHPGLRLTFNISGAVSLVGSYGYAFSVLNTFSKNEEREKVLNSMENNSTDGRGTKWNVGLRIEF